MFKLLFLTLIIPQISFAQSGSETIILKKFVPTFFGIKSRTIDKKEADAVLKEVQNFMLVNPSVGIDRIEIMTCTSDYELPQASITDKKIDEHVQLAKERNEMVRDVLIKALALPVDAISKNCGPEFKVEDLNDRFVTEQSGSVFITKFKKLSDDQNFVQMLKDEALVEDPESLKKLYTSPFLAKFKPFQGIRLFVWGQFKKTDKVEAPTKQPLGKNQ